MSKPEHIIAFDLSFSNTGVAIINTLTKEVVLDQVSTSPKQTFTQRIKALRDGLEELWRAYRHLQPYVVVEVPKGSQSARAAKCGAAATAIFYCSPFADLPMSVYGPKDIKSFVGYPHVKGTARKKLNIDKAFELYPDAPWRLNKDDYPMSLEEHKADAILLNHINQLEFNSGLIRG